MIRFGGGGGCSFRQATTTIPATTIPLHKKLTAIASAAGIRNVTTI